LSAETHQSRPLKRRFCTLCFRPAFLSLLDSPHYSSQCDMVAGFWRATVSRSPRCARDGFAGLLRRTGVLLAKTGSLEESPRCARDLSALSASRTRQAGVGTGRPVCVPRTGRRLRRLFRRALSLLSKRRDGVSLRGAEGDEAVSGAGVHGRTVVILHARTCVRGRII